MIKLNHIERKVLMFLVEEFSDEFGYFSFQGIQGNIPGLDRKQIRRACRSLARKGLTKYARGLWTDDGEPRGSGYAATDEGVNFINGISEFAPKSADPVQHPWGGAF